MQKNSATIMITTAAVGLLAWLAPSSVDAACPGSQFVNATSSFLVSNPDWAGAGGTEACGTGGCYDSVSGPPVSSSMRGVFWGLGQGNPVVGAGADSGGFGGGFAATDFWIKQVSAFFDPGGLYHYAAFASQKTGTVNGSPGGPITWSAGDVDGCGVLTEGDCTCVMLSDEWSGKGYFLTMSGAADAQFNTQLDPVHSLRLVPIPAPRITNSVRNVATADVTLQVTHLPLSGGTYPLDGCGTCLAGFKVYGQIVARGAAAPTERDTGWTELTDGAGSAQPVTPFNGTANVRADCDPALNQDLYLSIVLVGEGATPFTTAHVSENSTLVSCGATLANPDGPGNRPSDPRPDRGRDSRSRTR